MALFTLLVDEPEVDAQTVVTLVSVNEAGTLWTFGAGGSKFFDVSTDRLRRVIEIMVDDSVPGDHPSTPQLLAILKEQPVDEEDDPELLFDAVDGRLSPQPLEDDSADIEEEGYHLTVWQKAQPDAPPALSDGLQQRYTQRATFLPGSYASAELKAFRKRNGLREAREKGYKTANIAARIVSRVGPPIAVPQPPQFAVPMRASRGSEMNLERDPPKAIAGYLATVPCPMKDRDDVGADRHPVMLAEMYARAFPDLRTAWRRIRVVLGVNLVDDHRMPGYTTRDAAGLLLAYVGEINTILNQRQLPAIAVPLLWGIKTVPQKKGTTPGRDPVADVLVEDGAIDNVVAAFSGTTLRTQLANLPGGLSCPAKIPFPFATLRSAIVSCPEAAAFIEQLKATNEEVFFHTGDADLITILGDEKLSLFQAFDITISDKAEAATLARAGGSFRFDSTEVRQQLARYGLNADDTAASLLLTALAKAIDTAIREIVAPLGGVYFAEPNTLLNAKLLPILKESTNEWTASMPDWSTTITWHLRRSEDPWTEKFLSSYPFRLVTSARNALAIYSQTVASDRDRVVVWRDWTPLQILRALSNEHNTQASYSQLNDRFKEARLISGSDKVTAFLPATAHFAAKTAIVTECPWLSPFAVLRALWLESKEEIAIVEKNFMQMFDMADFAKFDGNNTSIAAIIDDLDPDALFFGDAEEGTYRWKLTNIAKRVDEWHNWNDLMQALLRIEIVFRWALHVIHLTRAVTAE